MSVSSAVVFDGICLSILYFWVLLMVMTGVLEFVRHLLQLLKDIIYPGKQMHISRVVTREDNFDHHVIFHPRTHYMLSIESNPLLSKCSTSQRL